MLFYLIIFGVSITTALLPLWLRIISTPRLNAPHFAHLLPAIASLLFLVSFFLPDIHISAETNTFQQHFVGGGIYSASLYYYLCWVFNVNYKWILDAITLFAWVSSLGMINKLLEFGLLKVGVLALDTTDAYWDLFGNTMGAALIYLLVTCVKTVRDWRRTG